MTNRTTCYNIHLLFVSSSCPECIPTKAYAKEHPEIQTYDISTPDGLAEASFFEIKKVPTFLVVNESDSIVDRAYGKEVLKCMKKWMKKQ